LARDAAGMDVDRDGDRRLVCGAADHLFWNNLRACRGVGPAKVELRIRCLNRAKLRYP